MPPCMVRVPVIGLSPCPVSLELARDTYFLGGAAAGHQTISANPIRQPKLQTSQKGFETGREPEVFG